MCDDNSKTTAFEFDSLDEVKARLEPMLHDLTEENSQIIYDEMSAMLNIILDIVNACESVDEVVELHGVIAPYFSLMKRITRKVKLVEDLIAVRAGKLAFAEKKD